MSAEKNVNKLRIENSKLKDQIRIMDADMEKMENQIKESILQIEKLKQNDVISKKTNEKHVTDLKEQLLLQKDVERKKETDFKKIERTLQDENNSLQNENKILQDELDACRKQEKSPSPKKRNSQMSANKRTELELELDAAQSRISEAQSLILELKEANKSLLVENQSLRDDLEVLSQPNIKKMSTTTSAQGEALGLDFFKSAPKTSAPKTSAPKTSAPKTSGPKTSPAAAQSRISEAQSLILELKEANNSLLVENQSLKDNLDELRPPSIKKTSTTTSAQGKALGLDFFLDGPSSPPKTSGLKTSSAAAKELEMKNSELSNQVADLTQKNEKLIQELNSKIDSLLKKLEEAKARIETLESQLETTCSLHVDETTCNENKLCFFKADEEKNKCRTVKSIQDETLKNYFQIREKDEKLREQIERENEPFRKEQEQKRTEQEQNKNKKELKKKGGRRSISQRRSVSQRRHNTRKKSRA